MAFVDELDELVKDELGVPFQGWSAKRLDDAVKRCQILKMLQSAFCEGDLTPMDEDMEKVWEAFF